LDVDYRRQAGETPAEQEYATRFPDAGALFSEIFLPLHEAPAALTVPGSENRSPGAERTGPYIGTGNAVQKDVSAQEADLAASASGSVPPAASRFHALRFHAEGGQGEVFVAEDVELHREVALKEIKPANNGHEDSRLRFVLEAEVTGNLEHPGIVPVYGLGTYPDSLPYYAMRFIRGDTLAAAIQQFHNKAPVRFDALEFRQLLGRFMAVCQAIAYAHNRGVLHRDLKPENIMVGKFGETLVVDWGLAKVVGRPDAGAAGPGVEGLLNPLRGGRAQTTRGVVGTPAYMSPEQAAGKVEELGPATDVYSLGATLYALLANRAPFKGPVVEVIKLVEHGAWLPPRQVDGAGPAALDAICRKALALRPEERYGSALGLAEDVEHYLGDELVAAYPEPARARLRRWMRKRPRTVTGAGVMLLALVVGLTAGTVFLEKSKRAAEENFRITREAAHKFQVTVNEEDLLNEPGMQPLRHKWLTQTLDYYKAFLEKRPGDPILWQERAEANRQLAEVYCEEDRIDEAKSLLKQSLAEYLDLREKAPTYPGLERGPAQAFVARADLLVRSGEQRRARDDVEQALRLLEPLSIELPDDAKLLKLLGRAHDLRATAQSQSGLLEEAIEENAKARRLLWKAHFILVQEFQGMRMGDLGHLSLGHAGQQVSANAEFRGQFPTAFLVFHAWLNQGLLQKRAGRKSSAAASLATAAESCRMLQGKYPYLQFYNPQLARVRIGLTVALLEAGHVQVELGRPGAGQASLQEALELARELHRDPAPASPEYKAILSRTAGNAGESLFRSGRTVRAATLLRESEAVAKAARTADGKNPALFALSGRVLSVLGRLEGERGNLHNGLRSCDQGRKEQERALQEAPWDRSLRSEWLDTREAIARLRFLAGQQGADTGAREQRKILEERNDLARQGPVLPYFQRKVAASAVVLAGLLLELGQVREATSVVEEVLPLHERLVREDRLVARLTAKPTDSPRKEDFQMSRRLLMSSPDLPGRFGDRQPLREPEDYELRRVWAELLARKGEALARMGQVPAAAACVSKAIAIVEELVQGDRDFLCPPCSWPAVWQVLALQAYRREPCYLYDLACHLALASTLSGQTLEPDPAGRAVQALRDFVASGFDNPHKLQTDQRLSLLRQRADFRKLILELRAQAGDQQPLQR
jgi:eukaryotic-like serine/threonine-protein kinase